MEPPRVQDATRRRRRVGLWVLVILAIGTSCGGGGRPPLAEWRTTWDTAVGSLPDRSSLSDTPDQELCSDILVSLREAEGEALPTPDAALDDPVRDWFALALDAFFECPPRTRVAGFEAAYDELDAFQAEVEAGIASLD